MFKKFKFSLLAIAFAMFVGIFVSCAPQPSDAASIYGTWKSKGDGYTITETTITYDDGEPYTSEEWGKVGIYGFTGEILDISNSSNGYIFVRYTILEEGIEEEYKGKYFAIHFKNLTEKSIELANPYKAGGKKYCTTLEEAKEEFTIENGYYGKFGEYVRN